MNRKRIGQLVALVGLAIGSQTALAGTITTTFAGGANFGAGPVGYFNGAVAPNPNSSTSLVNVGLGGDSFTSSNHTYDFSATGMFNTWCVDIHHWMSGGTVTYNVATGADLAAQLNVLRPGTPLGATRVSQLVQLANEVYKSVDTKVESAAFQLAVWAITYGTADGTGHYQISTSNSGFKVDSATAGAAYGVMANGWLANLGTAPDTGNYSLTYLNDNTPINNRVNYTQDMIVFTPVPEPGPLVILAIGLLALGFSVRKKV